METVFKGLSLKRHILEDTSNNRPTKFYRQEDGTLALPPLNTYFPRPPFPYATLDNQPFSPVNKEYHPVNYIVTEPDDSQTSEHDPLNTPDTF
ncbi:unnamed protein product, partial [Ilex paraguariensis]